MLTPKFEAGQDGTHVSLKIFAKYADLNETEITIDGKVFIFYSSPYYLRLTFSGKLVDSELEQHTATFDAEVGAFIIKCKKEVPNEHFENLDLLTSLLAPQGATGVNKPSIEVIGGDAVEDEAEDDFDWTCEQTLPEVQIVSSGYKYGFGNNSTGVFSVLQSELKGVVDIRDPDNKSALQRREERVAQEMSLFDEDHYLADYFDVDMTQQFIEFIPEFYSITGDEVEFTDKDKEDMLQLPRKELLLDKGTKSMAFLGLADILYAWCYDHRITLGEGSTESGWNIAKLSSMLSWLDSFTSLKDVAVSSMRRSLTFPLVRNWLLSQQVLKDTAHVLSLGRKKILKCLLEIRRIFISTDNCYILNQLYITDYCVWVQRVKENKFVCLGDSLRKVRLTKADVSLDLEDLETAAHLVLREEEEEEESLIPEQNINNLVSDMSGLTIIENGAVMGAGDHEPLPLEAPSDINIATQDIRNLPHLSNSDSSSSDSDSEEESDESSESSDSSDDSSEDSDKDSSDSSELDSDDDTLSENEDI